MKEGDKTYRSSISTCEGFRSFDNHVGVLPENKKTNLKKLNLKTSTHDSSDIIPLNKKDKETLSNMKLIESHSYITRDSALGRKKLNSILQDLQISHQIVENLNLLKDSDLFWDSIKEIEEINNFSDYVYDFSVPECESFVVQNVVAHNTLELPVDSLRELGYNIQPLKVRSALTSGGTEIGADEGIRTSLRMGDSALIVGEIRSTEAKALYEAMRIGALANVVAGTIHGDSPYGVYDRVVNDLGVPKTSFKATDIIVITNPVRSADGLHSVRRVVRITEVRKNWENDPLAEKGFVDLMKYDPKTDTLKPTDDLINGDSEVIKSIASNIPEWAGNWDAVWDNIILRAKMKESLVKYGQANKNILEAKFVIAANDHYHRISEGVKRELGHLEPNRIFFEWEEWLKRAARKTI